MRQLPLEDPSVSANAVETLGHAIPVGRRTVRCEDEDADHSLGVCEESLEALLPDGGLGMPLRYCSLASTAERNTSDVQSEFGGSREGAVGCAQVESEAGGISI